jgi:ABC-2 type transport system permease protein
MDAENSQCEEKKMSELKGVYALWYREIRVYMREKSRIISSIVNPIMWLLIIGGGLGASVSFGGINYQTFLFPGVLMQAALFSSIFFGVYIVWDKKVDFLKEVLVAPLSRTSIFFGKIVGGSTDTLIQITILLAIGYAFSSLGIISGLNLTVFSILLSLIILLVTTFGLVSIGLIIGSQMESPEGFQLIISFVIFPLFFLSGAIFPIENLPAWLSPLVFANPITYAVDAVRGILVGISQFNPIFDFLVICAFSAVMILIGSFAFKKMKV